MKKLLAILLALVMVLAAVPAMAAAAPEKWDISKSKTATNLDANYESKVTLSLPSAEEPLVSDIVFVLDKSTSAQLEQQALDMLGKLKVHVEETGATVKVGVVIFNKVANVANDGKFFNLATEYDGIEAAIKQEVKSGTNTHAGLLAGKKMLDDDKSVENNRKYLIFVSDGITYMYNAEPTVTAWSFWGDEWKNWAGPDNWNSKYGNNNPPTDWDAWLINVGNQIKAQGTEYEYSYNGTATKSTPQDDTFKNYANSIDKALYLTNEVYQEAKEAGYEPETAQNSIELKKGEYHDYHIYLNATRYTVEPGHSLALVITTEDPINCLIHKTYSVEIENASVTAEVPMTEAVENRVMTRK